MLCSDNCLVRELLELRQEPSKERGDRFRVLSEYYNSMDG